MADIGTTVGLIKALTPKIDPDTITGAVGDWLDDHPEATTTVEDGAITKAKLNASLQGTVDDVDDLKSAFETETAKIRAVTITETQEPTTTDLYPDITWTNDVYEDLSGNRYAAAGLRYSNKISVNEGDRIYYTNAIFKFRFITAYSDNVAVSASGVENQNSYTVPSGIDHIVISDYTSRGTAPINNATTITVYKNILDDDITELEGELSDINNSVEGIEGALENKQIWNVTPENVTWTTGKYMQANGGVMNASGLNYSSEITVSEGDILFYANDNYKFRFICAKNESGVVVEASGSNTDNKYYVVPTGIASVIVTVYDSAINSGTLMQHITAPTEPRAKVISYGNGSVIARTDAMTDDDMLVLPVNNCKIGSRYEFSCKVGTFGSVEFRKGNTHVIVDDTNIVFKNGSTTQLTVPHGLTIATEFSLTLQNETSVRPSYVSVSSLGDRFEFDGSDNVTFLLDENIPVIECVSGNLTNCAFSFTSSHIFKPVWVFGDSYLSWYDTRWTYYAAEDGNTENVFFSGYAGQNSQSALAVLGAELELATPKILVWCLGMNDPDTDSAVNDQWYMVYQQVEAICEEHGIELVLYTTPTTPIMNNRLKNAVVKASGHRYVDVDGLVRINNDGDWISGALATDNVHPTELGAKIIYHRFLSDLPEIMTR